MIGHRGCVTSECYWYYEEILLSDKKNVLLSCSIISSFLLVWTLRLLLFFCISSLSTKSFNLNESNMSPVSLVTFPRMTCMSPSPNPFSPEVCQRDPVDVLLKRWDRSMNRMLWGRRVVTKSLHYSLLYLFVSLGHDKYLI